MPTRRCRAVSRGRGDADEVEEPGRGTGSRWGVGERKKEEEGREASGK
jgi:hypothetical protein